MNSDTFVRLARAAIRAPSADNSQPFHIRLMEDAQICVSYDACRAAGKTFGPMDPATLISLGALLSNLRLEALSVGLEVDQNLHLERRSPAHCLAMVRVNGPDILPDLPDEQSPVLKRYTNRFPFERTPPQALDLRYMLEAKKGAAATRILIDSDSRVALASLVRKASEVRFQTREVHEWLAESLRFTKRQVESGDGLDIDTLALPPGGKVLLKFLSPWPRMALMNRLGLFKVMAAIDAAPVKAGPCLIAIVSPMAPQDIVNAGSLMEELWIGLNQRGLAVHPYYVVPDQVNRLIKGKVPIGLDNKIREVQQECAELLELSETEQLQMLLRVGYPTKQPKRSRRLPDSVLISNEEA